MIYFSYFLMTVLMFAGLFLIALILLQRGRGGGLAGAFGGMGGQSAFGTKAGDVFTKITIGVASAWILLCAGSVVALHNSSAQLATGFADPAAIKAEDEARLKSLEKQESDQNKSLNDDNLKLDETEPAVPSSSKETPAIPDSKPEVEAEKKAAEPVSTEPAANKTEEPAPTAPATNEETKPVEDSDKKPVEPEQKPEEPKAPEEPKSEQPDAETPK